REPSEDATGRRIVAVVAGADAAARGAGPGRGELHDRGLARGEVVRPAVHVVEEDGEFGGPGRVDLGDLVGERGPFLRAERQVRAEGRQPDPEAHPVAGAVSRELGEFPRIGEGRAPVAPQARVGLGRVQVEAVAPGREHGHGGAARLPGPGPAEESFDDAEFGLHGMSWRGSVPANYRPARVGRGSARIDTSCAPYPHHTYNVARAAGHRAPTGEP